MPTLEQELEREFEQYVGRVAEPARVARYAVDEAMIRNWVEAHDDYNPVYVDRDAARATGRPDVGGPRAMIATWVNACELRGRDRDPLTTRHDAGATFVAARSGGQQDLPDRLARSSRPSPIRPRLLCGSDTKTARLHVYAPRGGVPFILMTAASNDASTGFGRFGFDPFLLRGVVAAGFREPRPI
ncbi:MAG: MaoC family dehydratase N-terminal domain-containing protein, partial [Rhodococcus ruber]|nr:MaoC family dehydratase N-terminal domain-containing protein [Rhodococcus ruber]